MVTHYVSRLIRSSSLTLLVTLGIIAGVPRPGEGATTRRYNIDDHGNFMVFGNTVGFDCRDNRVEKPIVGSVPVGLLGLFSCNGVLPDNDTGVDILWRSDYPGNGQATASNLIDPPNARSTAVFALPTGAKVLMARLYWAAQRSAGLGAGTQVTLERPGRFSRQVMADNAAGNTLTIGGLDYYQSSADVTGEIQQHGPGPYRVGGIQTVDVRTRDRDVAFVAWNIVVFYHLDSDPIRNLSLFDGLERVATGASSTTNVTLNGFSVPATGFDARLGVIAYEGDNEISGDQLKVNNIALANTNNPADNFFNRSSTVLDALAPRTGDLPQMSGRPSSMSGYDADIIDITNRVSAGDQSLTLTASSTGDEYYLGVFATAVSTIRPIFTSTTKTVTNLSPRADGRFLPGDSLEYTIYTKNTGNDLAKRVVVTDNLPQGVTYTAGTLEITMGTGAGGLSDTPGNDQGEYDGTNRRITVRLGTGADGTTGGDMAINEEATFRFRVTIDATATGLILNQAFLSAVGETALNQGQTTPVVWPSGNGVNPNAPTGIIVTTCNSNAECPITAPICDTSMVPHKCVCNTNADCPGSLVCHPTTKQCVECIVGMNGTCNPDGPGGLCLANNTCGCAGNTDCNGRVCDTVNMICAAVSTNLSLTLTRSPTGAIVAPGTAMTYNLTATNNGTVTINGARLDTDLVPGQTGAWTCAGANGAVCPAATGNGTVDALVNLPPGGQLIYTFNVITSTDPASNTLDFTGSLQPPRGYTDTNPADNVVTDSVIVGMPPLGPDLTVTVREEPSETDSSVNYIIEVTNHGPGTAAGATVVYEVPAGAEVTLMPGEGWTCDRPNNGTQVICTRTQPIPEGMASPIIINVKGQPNQPELPLKVTVTASDGTGSPLADPNPGDNTVERTTTLNQFKLVGGGLAFGCSMGPGHDHDAAPSVGFSAALLAGFLGLLLMVRASRRASQRI